MRSVVTVSTCALLGLLLAGCGGEEVEKPAPGECVDVTSLNGDWGDDMWCARDDGTYFHTSYEGAHLWVEKHILPYSGRRASDPCTEVDRQYVRCTPTD